MSDKKVNLRLIRGDGAGRSSSLFGLDRPPYDFWSSVTETPPINDSRLRIEMARLWMKCMYGQCVRGAES